MNKKHGLILLSIMHIFYDSYIYVRLLLLHNHLLPMLIVDYSAYYSESVAILLKSILVVVRAIDLEQIFLEVGRAL